MTSQQKHKSTPMALSHSNQALTDADSEGLELDHSASSEYSPEPQNGFKVITNRIPSVIRSDEIAAAKIVLRRDRLTHFQDVGVTLQRLHSDSQGFDCSVICGKSRYSAHRSVLASHSGYFRRLLYQTGEQLPVDVAVDGMPSEGIEIVIDYMYSGQVKIDYSNAVDVLTTANILEMKGLADVSSDFINTLLAEENLMTTFELAERSGTNNLYAKAFKRLARNFYVQTKMAGFLFWEVDKVCRLLGNDHIVIETETHVFTAAMRWMTHDREDREQHFKRLMSCVRWMYMTTEEILKCVDQEQELMKSNDVRPILIDAAWYKTLKSADFIWKEYPIPLPRIRALRQEDPDVVVQRIRVSLQSRHQSFDNIWTQHSPTSEFGKTQPVKSSTTASMVHPYKRSDKMEAKRSQPLISHRVDLEKRKTVTQNDRHALPTVSRKQQQTQRIRQSSTFANGKVEATIIHEKAGGVAAQHLDKAPTTSTIAARRSTNLYPTRPELFKPAANGPQRQSLPPPRMNNLKKTLRP